MGIKTFNDLEKVGRNEKSRMEFIESAVRDYKNGKEYRIALDAIEYERQKNVTINRYRKLLYDLHGNAVVDKFTANHKCASNFFSRFVTQEAAYLLGNGVNFEDQSTKKRFGRDFDVRIYDAGKAALVQGVSYGFFNLDHVEIFEAIEFMPFYDEENGSMKAGIRFWQLADDKPIRYTLFEIDGYTDYIHRKEEDMTILREKRPYKQMIRTSQADGVEIIKGENYPNFPIIPLWGNKKHKSELIGMRENIDCYDLIKSGFANDLDDASLIYWTLENAGGMDDIDLAQFVERMKILKAAAFDGVKATAHTMDVPYEGRETYLTRLENDLYNDFMALNVEKLSARNVTATQIMAAYEPLNNKADEFEFCVIDFIQGLLDLIGIEDNPSFTRSQITNQREETEKIMLAANYLDDETILRKLPWLTPEEADEILKRRDAEDITRMIVGRKRESIEGIEEQR